MIPRVAPAIDPLAQRAAIQALEAQRAGYARLARTADDHRARLAGGDGDLAYDAADAAVRGVGELDESAQALAPMVAEAAAGASPDDRLVLDRQIEAVLREARQAEAAIHNLTAQLEAWRAAYARQLADEGIAVGATASADDATALGGAAGAARYGAPREAQGPRVAPSLIDRRG